MSKENNFFKNKKIIYSVIGIVLLGSYFTLFVEGKVDLTFTAEDLEVRTIDNKTDFEDIIVRNVYDKIVESCEGGNYTKKTKKYNNFDRGFDGDFMTNEVTSESSFNSSSSSSSSGRGLNLGASKVQDGLMGSADSGLSIPSIDFGGGDSKEKAVTQDVSFSQTNIQKQEVDEGDILKQTKDYVFYFSKKTSKIHIIKSPLNEDKIDIKSVIPVFTIDIPSNLTLKPELFVNDNRLVYLASKSAYNNHNTIVGVYDISNLENSEVELFKIFETKGEYFKSRLVDNKLYLISDYSLAPFKNQFCNIINKETESNFGDFLTFFTGIKFKGFGVNKELLNELKDELESYSYKFNGNNLDGTGNSKELSNFKLFYTNKDLKESIENLNFNIVSTVDIEKEDSVDSQVLVFGNLKNGEIHMTLNNLYLVNSYYQAEKWKCDYIDICHKEFASNNFTSISKISYDSSDLKYEKTAVIPGRPINQYSMDEDEGYFRIFTTNGSGNRDASLYSFNERLKLIGQLEKIKPNEQFKSSRFIGDKAFLVTFRQRDPLFVIDLHVPSDPKIIGELHIPGFSSYLHPYGKVGNKDYLIGIGKENNNVKVDLYEIDYDKKTLGDQIEVSQKHKFIFNGNSSASPAEDNPRSFVWDKDDKILYLPINIKGGNRITHEDCIEGEGGGCRLYAINKTTNQREFKRTIYFENNFTGLKALKIEIDNDIEEVESKKVSNNNDITNSRVGYYKNTDNNALFFVSPDFIGFFGEDDESKTIKFN